MSAELMPLPWLEHTAIKYTVALEDGATVVRYPHGSRSVKFRSDCLTCTRYGSGDNYFWPDHDAMRGCRSGGRDHCTCDGCF